MLTNCEDDNKRRKRKTLKQFVLKSLICEGILTKTGLLLAQYDIQARNSSRVFNSCLSFSHTCAVTTWTRANNSSFVDFFHYLLRTTQSQRFFARSKEESHCEEEEEAKHKILRKEMLSLNLSESLRIPFQNPRPPKSDFSSTSSSPSSSSRRYVSAYPIPIGFSVRNQYFSR